eukprot:CAMPEP_0169329846 /NCGR_PEP_ID=MMETSP1017-20121227/13329_1 /TAXON_ID=342587 /ORGANISM="Karlodinium micrum, Strain CCMP2283" /LENGTH=73 /DNA_ID=CAMNT_0009424799 /DNA_START=322 /DNA_END=543 /DNA_ORIENTATION=-
MCSLQGGADDGNALASDRRTAGLPGSGGARQDVTGGDEVGCTATRGGVCRPKDDGSQGSGNELANNCAGDGGA